mmetsp:Transcript_39669/g.92894  ORF Transcript_39669/g.92894 Transcript_39669/m.92894 type:complete len:141 (+) Transcript_39669:129-551(+)|eukprot:CAMPEP_0114111178 /NCGR_PEP_ID=MMETSP0043_2-20121206/1714_1 /TAXON_ID=464988 /ORGANISM="Hemiselmis andersenii, Strain CCMP644" /LENGTH=140 /DNA_ID=CAMNT_0001203191 /DNA_START=86 /DNA_END=508 /DNA_ORIENTATION=-
MGGSQSRGQPIYQAKAGCCGEIPTDGPLPEGLARAGMTPEAWGQYQNQVEEARKRCFPHNIACCVLTTASLGLGVICWLPLNEMSDKKFKVELAQIDAQYFGPLGIAAYGHYTASDNGGAFSIFQATPGTVPPQTVNRVT